MQVFHVDKGDHKINPATLRDWPHAPAHRLGDAGAYIVTAGTYKKEHFFRTSERVAYLTHALLTLAEEYGWRLQAWAVFSNHYHFVAESQQPASLKRLVQYLHSISAKHINLLDEAAGRRVWFEYWDTHLTYRNSFLSRLNYVHTNPVRHDLVPIPEQYPWCSAGWFARKASPAFRATVMNFSSDKVAVPDDYEVLPVE
jgi:putative transposase